MLVTEWWQVDWHSQPVTWAKEFGELGTVQPSPQATIMGCWEELSYIVLATFLDIDIRRPLTPLFYRFLVAERNYTGLKLILLCIYPDSYNFESFGEGWIWSTMLGMSIHAFHLIFNLSNERIWQILQVIRNNDVYNDPTLIIHRVLSCESMDH
jgi:hypothetical protein